MNELNEQEVRRRFAELRRHDTAHAPAFDRITARDAGSTTAPERVAAPWRVRTLALGTAAIAVVAAVVLVSRGRLDMDKVQALAEWHSETDVLLPQVRPTLYGAMPAIRGSVLDSIIPRNMNLEITR